LKTFSDETSRGRTETPTPRTKASTQEAAAPTTGAASRCPRHFDVKAVWSFGPADAIAVGDNGMIHWDGNA